MSPRLEVHSYTQKSGWSDAANYLPNHLMDALESDWLSSDCLSKQIIQIEKQTTEFIPA